MIRFLTFIFLLFGTTLVLGQEPPKTVEALFAEFDPQKDALDTKIVREWERDGIIFRYVTFHIGTFKETPARMAAFYGFPKGGKQLPGLLHLHGGGQRAFLHEVGFYAMRGYACLSINWGGREMENAEDGDPNTDWGAVDPTQKNVPGYLNLKPGDKYLDPFESPRNNNWYLLTLGARRGLTFLEHQPEVDANRLGVYGHSMGGNLEVTPNALMPVERVHIFYSVDPDPQARFWRTAEAKRDGNVWVAKLPIMSVEQPLFALAIPRTKPRIHGSCQTDWRRSDSICGAVAARFHDEWR